MCSGVQRDTPSDVNVQKFAVGTEPQCQHRIWDNLVGTVIVLITGYTKIRGLTTTVESVVS
jgi:hypothetical protein